MVILKYLLMNFYFSKRKRVQKLRVMIKLDTNAWN